MVRTSVLVCAMLLVGGVVSAWPQEPAANTITCSSGTACKKGHIPVFSSSGGAATEDDSIIRQSGSTISVTGNETATMNISAGGNVNGTVVNATTSFDIGGSPFAFGSATGYQNVFIGFAGNSTMSNASLNTAAGVGALQMNTTGSVNTAYGGSALGMNTSGNYNSADGWSALAANTSGSNNIAVGSAVLGRNTTGSQNTAIGYAALVANTTANLNTAAGYQALQANSTGYENTAMGSETMNSNTTGYYNTAVGRLALQTNTTGALNTAVGFLADVGSNALINATALGAEAVVSGSNTLVLGSSLSNNGMANTKVGIDLPNPTQIFQILQGAGAAYADGWGTYSSRRLKTNIRLLEGALAKVEQLRGVSYDLKSNGKHEIGVIAEEVGTVVPEVVSWDENGKDAMGVDYSRLTALLIEATKEQQSLIQQQQEQIAKLSSQVKAIRALLTTNGRTGSQIRSVKAQVSAMPR
jgi:hypothetical protein